MSRCPPPFPPPLTLLGCQVQRQAGRLRPAQRMNTSSSSSSSSSSGGGYRTRYSSGGSDSGSSSYSSCRGNGCGTSCCCCRCCRAYDSWCGHGSLCMDTCLCFEVWWLVVAHKLFCCRCGAALCCPYAFLPSTRRQYLYVLMCRVVTTVPDLHVSTPSRHGQEGAKGRA